MGGRVSKLSTKRILPLLLGVVFAASFVASIGEPVAAFGDGKFSEADYSASNIWAYDPRVPLCGGGASATSLVGADNRQKIYNYWISAGLKPAQAAGITGSMQAESGFSPFRQETSQTWPAGGYGIAQFTGGQRVAVTTALKTQLGDTFTQNYIPTYGGGVTEAKGFVPDGVSADVNNQFLLGELNYLNQYITAFAPSQIPARTSGLSSDYSLTVPKDMKLLDYIKTLTTPAEAAEAWTYLYEYPGDIKATAAVRATNAADILTRYSAASDASTGGCSAVGVGGLSYAQGITFMKGYYNDRFSYLTPFWSTGQQRWQCTTLVFYFNQRFVTPGTGWGNGRDVASNLISGHPNSYKAETKDTLQPFSVFSLTPAAADAPGHTGLILGIESDGSVVVGESNMSLPRSMGPSSGLIEQTISGSKSDEGPSGRGVSSVEHWASIDKWEAAMRSIGYPGTIVYAALADPASVTAKVQASLGGAN